MKLHLRDVPDIPGSFLPVDVTLDFGGLELSFQTPLPEPVPVRGEVRNTAGVVQLSVVLEADLRLRCDRCLAVFQSPYRLPVEVTLGRTKENDENENIVLIKNGAVDIDEIVRDAFILDFDMVSLCREDCQGLCPRCGQNLNETSCQCEPEIDPRLAALQKYL